MITAIEHFLRTGEFGPIRLGDSYARVTALLGEPDDFMVRSKGNDPKLLKYGAIEFCFVLDEDFSLAYILADHFDVLDGGAAIKLDPWVLRGHVTIEEVEHALRSAHIAFEPDPNPGPDTTGLITQAGVRLLFGLQTPEDPGWSGLLSISLAEKPLYPPRWKQIMVTMSMDDYELIRRESVRTGIKIGKLCGAWLAERAKAQREMENPT